jgi:hypothetical protein
VQTTVFDAVEEQKKSEKQSVRDPQNVVEFRSQRSIRHT